jgi:hypothetical protein
MTLTFTATLAFILWPFVGVLLFRTQPLNKATLWTILGAHLLLPVGVAIKFQGVPAFDKYSISNICAVVGCTLVSKRLPRIFPRLGLPEFIILMSVISPFIMAELNTDPINIGRTHLPGEAPYDALSTAAAFLIIFFPFVLARQFFRSSQDIAEIMRALVIAGLIYSLPMLFEIRFSPQLHYWVYGYVPYDNFLQQVRDAGFRPMVFLGHGLMAAFYMVMMVTAAGALWRTRTRIARLSPPGVTAYLYVVLLVGKSFGAIFYATILLPLVLWATPRVQIYCAVILTTFALAYPLLRSMDFIPTQEIVAAAATIDRNRADSLNLRFVQEKLLLERASERLWFGWGGYGRNRVYESEVGRDVSVTDGQWIIDLGTSGLVGFLLQFGLLAIPVFRASTALKNVETAQDKIYLAALALILSINLVDLIPNSTITPWTWLLAGALLGRSEALLATKLNRKVQWNGVGNIPASEIVARRQSL